MITVVHCKQSRYTHYIGRPSAFGNRYSHKPSSVPGTVYVGSRSEAIRLYEQDARDDYALLQAIYALPEDAVLGCWCPPLACHGSVIITLWREMHGV